MSITTQSCYIRSVDKLSPPIYVPDKTPIFLGRDRNTLITDISCSRQQVWLLANYPDQKVLVRQVGSNPSGINGFKTSKDVTLVASHGDCLEILYNIYKYRIEFNPPLEEKVEIKNVKKRVHESSSEDDKILSKVKKFKLKNDAKKSDVRNNEVASSSKKLDNTESLECKDESNPMGQPLWEDVDRELLIYTSKGVTGRSKIAAYDMDGTLIKTKSGYVFPKDYNDWQIIYSQVPGKLKKLHKEGYKIVIFTNQGSLSAGKYKLNDFKVKIERVVNKIGVPIQVFIATGKSTYRKPLTGMWDTLVNDKNDGVLVDKESSFFVGDAAGRPANWAPKKKKDHSSADRLLALNLDLKFETPEEHFFGQKPVSWVKPGFDPKSLNENAKVIDPPSAKLVSGEQEVVILVGGPGSGKSHFASTHLSTYHRINQDTLGSWQRCIAALEKTLSAGGSAVIDNTNPNPPVRQRYIDVAKAHGVPVRCFLMKTDPEHSKHNNKFRQLTDSSHDTISEAIINAYIDTKSQLIWRCIRFVKLLLLLILRIYTNYFLTHDEHYRKNFKPPTLDEGYTEIVNINFVPKFNNEREEKLYRMYLMEK